MRPGASVGKLVVLAAYDDAVTAGTISPDETVSLSEIDRFHVPGTDGGAHEAALDEIAASASHAWTVGDVVRAMVEHSDNAAAEWLMRRLGEPMIAAAARRYGTEAPAPFTALLTAGVTGAADLPASAWADQTKPDRDAVGAWTNRLGYDGQSIWAEHTPRMSADSIGRILRHAALQPRMREPLSWPLRAFRANRRRFGTFLAKGGSYPGVLTQAFLLEPRDGVAYVAIVQLTRLDEPTWTRLQQRGALDELLVQLATDDEARASARALLR